MIFKSEKTAHGNVGVSYISQVKADEQAQEMENNGCWYCSRCSDCSRCSGCSGCSRCSGCSGCSDCSDCSRCSGCSDCSDCSGCSDCSRCSGCSGCSRCSGCSGCSDCSDCSRCSGCSGCSRCSGCSDCSRCSGCSDCSDCKYFVENKISVTPEQAAENLEKVRAIILDDVKRLEMGHWHGNEEWKDKTCAEEAVCGTTHCLAGWLQVCNVDDKIRSLETQTAGAMCAPIAAKMFFHQSDEVIAWLENRDYLTEMGLDKQP